MSENLERFQDVVQDWNQNMYGNIFMYKRILVSELAQVKRILELWASGKIRD